MFTKQTQTPFKIQTWTLHKRYRKYTVGRAELEIGLDEESFINENISKYKIDLLLYTSLRRRRRVDQIERMMMCVSLNVRLNYLIEIDTSLSV
jgi:hypothetical protein